jgi:hypothetical protein
MVEVVALDVGRGQVASDREVDVLRPGVGQQRRRLGQDGRRVDAPPGELFDLLELQHAGVVEDPVELSVEARPDHQRVGSGETGVDQGLDPGDDIGEGAPHGAPVAQGQRLAPLHRQQAGQLEGVVAEEDQPVFGLGRGRGRGLARVQRRAQLARRFQVTPVQPEVLRTRRAPRSGRGGC